MLKQVSEKKNQQRGPVSSPIGALSAVHDGEDAAVSESRSQRIEQKTDQMEFYDCGGTTTKAEDFKPPDVEISNFVKPDDKFKTVASWTRHRRAVTDVPTSPTKKEISNNEIEYKKSNSFSGPAGIPRVQTNFIESEVIKKWLVHKKKNLANTLKELHITKMNQLYVKDPKTGHMSVTVRDLTKIRVSASNEKAIVVMSDKGERKYIFTNLGDKLDFMSIVKSRKHVRPAKGLHTSIPLELKESELELATALYPCEAWREGAVVKHKGKLLVTRYRLALLESGPRVSSLKPIKGSKVQAVKGMRHSKGIEIVNEGNITGILCVKALGVELLAIESISWDRDTLVVHCKDLRVLHFRIFLIADGILDLLKTKLYEKVYPGMNQVSSMYAYRKWFETKKAFCEKNCTVTFEKDIDFVTFKLEWAHMDALARELSDTSSVIYTEGSWMSDEERILRAEFRRVTRGLLKTESTSNSSILFRISEVNEKFDLCSTYPRYLIVPHLAGDDLLRKVAEHRSKGRIPAIVWVSKKNRGVHISRCAQPGGGILDTGGESDIIYVDLLRKSNTSCPCPQLVIVDCRPRVNANVNKLKGKGFENIANYKECFFQFFDIHNIHKMRDSLSAVKKMMFHPQDDGWYAKLDNTSWIIYMRSILSCAAQVVNIISQQKSVMIHCSDGWDRTSQVSALSQLLLDNYYRSCKGFLVLVRKEWMWFGHMISTRNGNFGVQGVPTTKRDQRSPVFIQWLECVYQILRKFPTAFEFTEQFLLDIAKCWNSGEFGDFFFNSEKERREQTAFFAIPRSMHKWFEQRLSDPNNPYVSQTSDWKQIDVLHHQFAVRELVLWERLHCPFDHNDIEVGTVDVLYRSSIKNKRVRPPAPPRDLNVIRSNSGSRLAKLPENATTWTKEGLEKKIESLRRELQIYGNKLQAITKSENAQLKSFSDSCASNGKFDQSESDDEIKLNDTSVTYYV